MDQIGRERDVEHVGRLKAQWGKEHVRVLQQSRESRTDTRDGDRPQQRFCSSTCATFLARHGRRSFRAGL
jgi:hypothetical protein